MAIIVAACAAYGFQILTEKNGGESVNDINVLLYVSAQAVAEPPVFVIERRCRRHAVGEVNSRRHFQVRAKITVLIFPLFLRSPLQILCMGYLV
jgi:hypothetical protein